MHTLAIGAEMRAWITLRRGVDRDEPSFDGVCRIVLGFKHF